MCRIFGSNNSKSNLRIPKNFHFRWNKRKKIRNVWQKINWNRQFVNKWRLGYEKLWWNRKTLLTNYSLWLKLALSIRKLRFNQFRHKQNRLDDLLTEYLFWVEIRFLRENVYLHETFESKLLFRVETSSFESKLLLFSQNFFLSQKFLFELELP